MSGDLLQKLSIQRPHTAPLKRTADKPVAPLSQTYNGNGTNLEYSAAATLSPANTNPLGLIPHSPAGHLVKENIFQSAGSTVKSYGKYAKYFYDAAFKGEGTDYSVGKINDLTIRAGSLGIAGILAATKMFPFAKGMEFVGLGTWFASMAIWPKVIGAPVKALYGVDMNQKYVDSYGRRKSFFEDPQYLPWDLYRHIDKHGKYNPSAPDYEYLNKVGDKLGIPKNIENRNEAIQDKMRQVATQGNALWMLTAGVMTPVISSLVADAAQTPLSNAIEKYKVEAKEKSIKAMNDDFDSILKAGDNINLDTVISKFGINVNSSENVFDTVLKEVMTPKEEEAFLNLLSSKYGDSEFLQGIKEEFKSESIKSKKVIKFDSAFRNELIEASNNALESYKTSLLDKYTKLGQTVTDFYQSKNLGTVSPETKIESIIETLSQKANKRAFGSDNIVVLSKFKEMTLGDFVQAVKSKDFTKLKASALSQFNGLDMRNIDIAVDGANYTYSADGLRNYGKEALVKEIKGALNWVLGEKNASEELKIALSETISKAVEPVLEKYETSYTDVQKVKKLLRMVDAHKLLEKKIDEYAAVTIKDISEAITANSWSKVPQKYLSLLGFSKSEITKMASMDMRSASEILSEKLEQLVKNPEKMDKAVKEMSKTAGEAISKEEKALLNLIGTADKPGILCKLKELFTRVSRNEGFSGRIDAAIDTNWLRTGAEFDMKFKNTVNSFARPIKAIDQFTRIDNFVNETLGRNVDEFLRKISNEKSKLYAFNGLTYEESKEALTKFAKRLVLENADINNWWTKFETTPEGMAKGFKWSEQMADSIKNFLYAEFSENIATKMPKKLVGLMNDTTVEMGWRYVSIFNELLKNNCIHPHEWLVNGAFLNNAHELSLSQKDQIFRDLDGIEQLWKRRRFEFTEDVKKSFRLTMDGYRRHVSYYDPYYDVNGARDFIMNQMKFATDNRRISKMAGKDVSDFFLDAARNVRSRSKWTKLVWSLFGGAVGISAITIALMGKKNYFNKDIYTVKGGNDANK